MHGTGLAWGASRRVLVLALVAIVLRPVEWRKDDAARTPCFTQRLGGNSQVYPRAAVRRRALEAPQQDSDWREFRARLVAQEQSAKKGGEVAGFWNSSGWAYSTTLLERGSILLAQPGSRFGLRQQYFHKAVVLLIRHDKDGTIGLIVNRPTARLAQDARFSSSDTVENVALRMSGLLPGASAWNVWFGGDCHGLDCQSGQVHFCLHTRSDLAQWGDTIISGAYLIRLSVARMLVATGQADPTDFMVLVGYCGWKPGQLQEEIQRGESWCVAAADSRALLGDLQCTQRALGERTSASRAASVGQLWPGALADVPGDGMAQWERLFAPLDSTRPTAVGDEVDTALRLWIENHLVPKETATDGLTDILGWPKAFRQLGPTDVSQPSASATLPASIRVVTRLPAGTVLRASATAWVLGSPDNSPILQRTGFSPAQYMHKAVFVLVSDWVRGMPAYLTLLTGPRIGFLREESMAVFYGGSSRLQHHELLQEPTGVVVGQVKLPPLALEELLANRALTIAWKVDLVELISVPRDDRWEAAGGNLSSVREASISVLGDQLRRRWYQEVMKLEPEV
mmetsp:Transcript_15553/g.35630  ORF Transcript_15553/g.35630 Transcript_15553/m.35630 type:complete len:569 (+) Transcript_15553:138-1844(+)